MFKILTPVTIGCISLLLAACGSSDDSDLNASHYTLQAGSNPLYAEGIKSVKVLDNEWDYSSELSDYQDRAGSNVDFSEYQVLLIDLGVRPSAGYAIRFDNITDEGDYVLVQYSIMIPASGTNCAYDTALSNPYLFEAIRSKKEILIREAMEESACSSGN
ncbi:MAG: hypothetical protein CMI03_18470 [Oceanospirillaceae bacterium]|uniref:protease complex subunit PrcB family protein n=1 Tax=unclassified Thalassolituus TaxID=2624967 RepID=UPI000C4A3563|nr:MULTISPECIES: protease complex subunit PrcB family protein [unclassified Thalassolituus]MBL34539.1 hypothetical protein [Oceanospirillaceae bacterium]MBS54727.1 hypothetical protein [Oceanospirillaceae bacterium]|tara:strand:- start:1320 stop:1799 length:480 start_codon:yes stop_codon:yes gene_type:complete